MAIFPKPYADFVQRLRVPLGILAAGGFGWFSQPTLRSLLTGFPVALAGMALRSWAAGHLRKDETLTTSGPYAWVRNPLYLGTLLGLLGCLASAAQPVLALATLIAFVLIYTPVVEQEESHLREIFPAYAAYAMRVPALVPWPPRAPSELRFCWAVWRRNKEYKGLLALGWAYAFLIGKALLSA